MNLESIYTADEPLNGPVNWQREVNRAAGTVTGPGKYQEDA